MRLLPACACPCWPRSRPLQARPYQYPGPPAAPSTIKALRGPRFPPKLGRAAVEHLCQCARCRRRPANALEAARAVLATTVKAANEIDACTRRLTYQVTIPGGLDECPRCIDSLMRIDLDTQTAPALSEQAVSPRFLRRLCKLYTSYDLTVDHQVELLHARPDVDRSPHLGEAFAADRFRCDALSAHPVCCKQVCNVHIASCCGGLEGASSVARDTAVLCGPLCVLSQQNRTNKPLCAALQAVPRRRAAAAVRHVRGVGQAPAAARVQGQAGQLRLDAAR